MNRRLSEKIILDALVKSPDAPGAKRGEKKKYAHIYDVLVNDVGVRVRVRELQYGEIVQSHQRDAAQ